MIHVIRHVGFCVLAIALIFLCYSPAVRDLGSHEAERPSSYVITGVSVVDVGKGEVIPDQTVVIQGERIEKISSKRRIKTGKASEVIDGFGLYLLPGLVDAHVHYLDPETFGPLMIAHGVVLVRDMGNMTPSALLAREKLEKREILGPTLVTTGRILDGIPPIRILRCWTKSGAICRDF